MNRRNFLKTTLAASMALTGSASFAAETLLGTTKKQSVWNLNIRKRNMPLPGGLDIPFLGYTRNNDDVLRGTQGETVQVRIDNFLDEPTSLHWHGFILPADKDGVPGLAGKEIPKASHDHFNLELRHAGTYWVHPHIKAQEQVGLGLASPVIVDDLVPYDADIETVMLIQDWSIDKDGNHMPFYNMHSMSHGGRTSRLLTVNKELRFNREYPAGSRVRLRLINACTGRTAVISNPYIQKQKVWIISRDGHPLPHGVELADKHIYLGAGQRLDIVFDMPSEGESFTFAESRYGPTTFAEFKSTAPQRDMPARHYEPKPLPDNGIILPTFGAPVARKLTFELSGGAMGDMTGADPQLGMYWTINGKPVSVGEPLAELIQGDPVEITFVNNTLFEHPMHLHGMAGYARDVSAFVGDSVLVLPKKAATLTLIPTEKGKWASHCHVLGHAASGLSGHLLVS